MGDANIFISNGTCYSAAGKRLDSSFIPCGNAAFGHQTCCGAGDNCLGDKACFGIHGTGYGSYLTYVAGCTDPDYKDGSCPDKEGIDQPWVALTLCDNTDGVWAACSQEGNPETLKPGSFCSCTDTAKATVAFSDANTLPNTASLPQGTGSSVQFFAGYVPTPPGTTIRETTTAPPPPPLSSKHPSPNPPPSPSESRSGESQTSPIHSEGLTTSAPSPPGNPSTGSGTGTIPPTGSNTASRSGTGTTSPGNTNPSSPSSNTASSGLSPGAKAGIGVGAAAAVLLLLAAIIALFLHHRRKRRADTAEVENASVAGGGASPHASKKHNSIDHPPSDISEADGQPARPWSMRSELEGSQVPGTGLASGSGGGKEEGVGGGGGGGGDGMLSPIAELPGSVPPSGPPGQGCGGDGRDGRRRVVVGDSVVYL